jgi:TPR repeat protein
MYSSSDSLIDPQQLGGDYNAESKYNAAITTLSDLKSTSRDVRRTIAVLEELSLGTGRVSADSLAELGMLHLVGTRVGAHNFAKAAEYSQRAAALGSPKGRHTYAFLLLYGSIGGIRRNETEAWRQVELAAQQNYLPALMANGYHHLNAGHCDTALRHYRAAALTATGIVESKFHGDYGSLRPLSMTHDSLGDFAVEKAARDIETLSYWNFLSDRKDPRAFYELGRIYQMGYLGLRRDMKKAAEFFEKAGLLGHASALGELGRLYSVGNGRELDYHTALKYLQQGAHLADATGGAMATLGHLLSRQVYSSEDGAMALMYLRRAAALNNMVGKHTLAA